MNRPFFTIVIANYNHGRYLEEALQSVFSQSCQDFEVIVVDGGSSDNSVDVIRKCEDRITWWCSEKDNGQSHAFNKGFAKASGRFFTWLNADDLLLPKTLEKAKKKLTEHPKLRWMTGNFIRFLNDGNIFECKWGPHYLPWFLQNLKSPIVVFGPSSFFSKDLYYEIGAMDETLHFMMDTDLWIRFISKGERQIRLNHYCWAFRMHEESKTAEFGSHLRDGEKLLSQKKEREIVFQRSCYSLRKHYKYISLLTRVIDGSLPIYLWNQFRWRGRPWKDIVK